MRLPRMTTSRWMLVVAVFAIAQHVGMLSQDYRRRARAYARAEGVALFRARNVESGVALLVGYTAEEKRNVVDQARRAAASLSRLKAKYERAAYLPFLPVGSDPPAP